MRLWPQKKAKDEVKDPYSQFGETIERDYLQARLLKQIDYYSRMSRRLQKEYYIMSITSTVLMAAVPVILMLPDTMAWAKYVSAALSAAASMLSSILLILRSKENWIEYRTTSEALKSELASFKTKSGDYQTIEYSQRFSLFVDRCERIMQAERTGWYSRMKLDPSQEYVVKGTSEDTGS